MDIQNVPLDRISVEGKTQMRIFGVDPGVAAEYAEAMEAGAEFPAIVLFHDGNEYWPGDGFHRLAAARRVGRATIPADVRQGTRRDAILFAVGANADHGLRRSQADKRNAVETLLRDPEWSSMSDRKIADAAKVDHKTVGRIRREMTGEFPTSTKQVGKSPRQAAIGHVGSMVEQMLRTVPEAALIAECKRRGLEVSR